MLIIGFGNPRRRDEAIAYQAAEMLGGVACFYLTLDLARTVASTDRVVFLDAAVGDLSVSMVEPAELACDDPHMPLTPGQLLGAARRLFGRSPQAWLIRGGAAEFGFGESLSLSGLANMQRMMSECDRLSREAVVQ
jgi:Ni,Fe-hydrogenase maturation factor